MFSIELIWYWKQNSRIDVLLIVSFESNDRFEKYVSIDFDWIG